MYAIKHYMYLHKQDCELFGWLTLLSMCICRLCMCALLLWSVCACVSMCAPRELSCSGCILTFDLC